MLLTIRQATVEDAEAVGQICYDACENVATAHGFPKDFPSPGFAAGLLGTLIAHPGAYGVVAE